MLLAHAVADQAGGRLGVLVDAYACAVQPYRLLRQGVDAQPGGQEHLIDRRLIVRAAEHGEHVGQPVVGQVGLPQAHAEQVIERLRARRRPVPHRHQAVVAFH